jgi:hypothetical protein
VARSGLIVLQQVEHCALGRDCIKCEVARQMDVLKADAR